MDDVEFLCREFEYERCTNCGGDAPDHTVIRGPFGELRIVCNSEL
jgi:hypothetical protein